MNIFQQDDWGNPGVPEWANAVVVAPCGSQYYVEAWGVNSKRQEVGSDFICAVGADMTSEGNAWRLVSKRPVAWTGEGLPPVGTVCEYKRVHEWQKVEVFAIKPNHNGSHTALFTYENGTWCGCAEPSLFRPIRTPDQIARDKGTAEWIAQIEKEYGWDTAAECERILIEGGYRKQVAP